jgi:RNA polymerase sigma-70 factor (ECF subfamily)
MPTGDSTADAEERVLIDDAAKGSHDALSSLFELHSAHVYRVAYRLTMSPDDAEDVVQDVFIGLPEALAAYSRNGGFAAWLRAIAIRTALMRMRSRRRRAATAARASTETQATDSDGSLDRVAIAAALSSLASDLRVVFMLSDVEGYSHAEIGKLLGIRAGTSEVRLHRARRKLRALLGDQ